MAYPEYYNELGVSPSADMKEIKSAYRKLAKKYHPDLNPGDKKAEDKLKKINAAYDVLSDFSKRAEYDYFGQQAEKAMQEYQEQAPAEQTKEKPIYRKENTPQDAPQKNPTKPMSFGRLIFNRTVILGIFIGYLMFLHSNIDKNDPQNIKKMMNNSSAVLVDKVKDIKDWFVENIASVDWKQKFLFIAVKNNWVSNLTALLEKNPDAQIVDEKGYSLLMYAPTRKVAEILLAYGADINYVAPDDETPYSQALRNNRRAIINLYLEKGVKMRIIKPAKKSTTVKPSTWKK